MPYSLPHPPLITFREKFWDAFHRPALQSPKYLELWESLEEMNSWLAGPMFAIYENGNCDFVFTDKNRFGGVNSQEDFLEWAGGIILNYGQSVNNLLPTTEIEIADQNLLKYQIDIKEELLELYQKTYITNSKNV